MWDVLSLYLCKLFLTPSHLFPLIRCIIHSLSAIIFIHEDILKSPFSSYVLQVLARRVQGGGEH